MIAAASGLFWVAVLVLVHTYVVYPLVLPVLARLFGRPVRADESLCPSVAFVVPVYNEEAVIEAKLRSILALDYPAERLSVWVGSDCSTDRTEAIVKAFADPRVHLWVAPSRGGKTGVLNGLAPQIGSEILVFTDANTMHDRESLRRLVAPFADPTVGGVAGHIDHSVVGSEQPEERFYRSFESRQKRFEALLHSSISAYGGFYAIRAALFRPVPPNAYSNDDVLIPMSVVRGGHRMWFEMSARSHEDATEDLGLEYKRRARIGAGNFQSLVWLADFLNPARGWPWFCYVSHKVCRWVSPVMLVLAGLSCLTLCLSTSSPFYWLVLCLGLGFILAGLSARFVPLRLTSHILYFLAMNLALMGGLVRFLGGIRSPVWDRTMRR